jgi:hypothetical protein
MEAWILIIVLAWFALGGIIAAFIYLDIKARKSGSKMWPAMGFLLNLIALLAYDVSVKISRRHPYQYPPTPSYGEPNYDFDRVEREPAVEGESEEEKPSVEYIEGIPRCPHCGAAISAHDWECPRCGARIRY